MHTSTSPQQRPAAAQSILSIGTLTLTAAAAHSLQLALERRGESAVQMVADDLRVRVKMHACRAPLASGRSPSGFQQSFKPKKRLWHVNARCYAGSVPHQILNEFVVHKCTTSVQKCTTYVRNCALSQWANLLTS